MISRYRWVLRVGIVPAIFREQYSETTDRLCFPHTRTEVFDILIHNVDQFLINSRWNILAKTVANEPLLAVGCWLLLAAPCGGIDETAPRLPQTNTNVPRCVQTAAN